MEDAIAKVTLNADEAEDVVQLVGFEVAEELFGVDILMVQEILKDIAITAIPDSPDSIVGVVNLRGNIIPVVNLRKRLKLSGDKAGHEDLLGNEKRKKYYFLKVYEMQKKIRIFLNAFGLSIFL